MFDLVSIIKVGGYLGILAIIFAESGLFFGFFLPGDSLLFTAGFLASQGFFNVWLLIFLSIIAAIAGDSVGYWFGSKIGPAIFTRPDSWIFSQKRVEDARKFFDAHGPKSVVMARFVPAVRTFVPILAGVGHMEYRKFLTFNIIGSFLWAGALPLLGYFLGAVIPDVDKYILPIVLAIVVASFLPIVFSYLKARRGEGV